MNKKNDRIVKIVSNEPGSDHTLLRDELLRLSGAFGTLGQLKPQDLKRLAEKGLDPTLKLIILTQMLLPQLCSIIGRGLTLEEIGFLVGSDEKAIKYAIKKPDIVKVATITPGKVDEKRFMKVLVPLRTTIHTTEEDVQERPVKEPLLASRHLVERVQRRGYITSEGRVLRHDYLSLVSGPLPTVYSFQNNLLAVEEVMNGENWKEAKKGKTAHDQSAIMAELEIAVAVLRFLKPLFMSDHALIIAQKLAGFFYATYENAVHYASRHRALNDQATFDRIEALARPLLLSADGLERSEWVKDKHMRESVAIAIDEVLEELEAVIQGRALLLPDALSELTEHYPI